MAKPKSIVDAKRQGYIVDRIVEYNNSVDIILKPRFYNSNLKAVINFWVTFKGFRRLKTMGVL